MEVSQIIEVARDAGRTALDEKSGKKLLSDFGVVVPKTTLVRNVEEAVKAVKKLNFPVVLKVVSQDILHKSDAGGVVVGLQNITELKNIRSYPSRTVQPVTLNAGL